MYRIALKMLMGDRGKYLGLIMGLTFAALLITQQSSIFTGLMTRTYSFINDLSQPDVWVMDPKVQFIDDVKPLQDTELIRVRGITGVEWAVPLYKGLLKARLEDGNFQIVNVLGLDDATLIGGPPTMIEGSLSDLRKQDAIIVNDVGASTRLAKKPKELGAKAIPLQVGEVLEINDKRAVVVGICRVSRTFNYYMKSTGIPINFGIAVMLGFLIGTAIAGQTFYNFTLENLRYFGTLKAMGTTNAVLLRMIVLQALVVGALGYGLGVGGAALFGYLMGGSPLDFAWASIIFAKLATPLLKGHHIPLSPCHVQRWEGSDHLMDFDFPRAVINLLTPGFGSYFEECSYKEDQWVPKKKRF